VSYLMSTGRALNALKRPRGDIGQPVALAFGTKGASNVGDGVVRHLMETGLWIQAEATPLRSTMTQ